MKPYLAAFDTEDDGAGHPTLFACVHERGQFWSRSRDRFLEQLEQLRERAGSRELELWATNLEYDVANLFGPERIAECRLQFGRAQLYGARWRRIKMRDTFRFIPSSVEKLGELVGLPKLHRDASAAYCIRDAAITYRAARYVRDTFEALGEQPRMTLPATVYALWLRKDWQREVQLPRDEIVEAGRAAYYGGRVECFALGDFEGVRVIDVASMFPWAMTAGTYPVPWGPSRRIGYGGRVMLHGIYHADVESELFPGVLPYRSDEGTVYPTGRWRAWYTGLELAYFAQLGGRVRVRDGFEFAHEVDPFRTYVRRFFKLKARSRGAAREVFKLCLNSLYGKFGQTGELTRCETAETFLARRDVPEGTTARYWAGLVLWREERRPPPWGNMIWPAITTARARVRLHQEMIRLGKLGNRLLYCDTDSIMYQGAESYPLRASSPGVFELRGDFRRALIVGKKEYGLELEPGSWEFHAKGVPRLSREQYLREGHVEFMLPARLRGAARDGVNVNEWRPVTKTRRKGQGQRPRSSDGSLSPVRVEELAR